MTIRHGNLGSSVAHLFLTSLLLFACLTLFAESAHAQQPAPTPIRLVDDRPVGEPERVDLGGGKYKLVYKNKAGQVLREEEYALGVKVSEKFIDTVFPNGQEEQVRIEHFDPIKGKTREVTTVYDRYGGRQYQETYERFPEPGRYTRATWDPETRRWEPVPENLFWNFLERRFQEIKDGTRFNPDTGRWEKVPPSTTPTPSDASDNRPAAVAESSRATLEAMDGIKRSTSASPGYGAESTVANGLSVVTFTTPQGTIYVNLPSDMAAGNTLTGTVVGEPKAEDPKQRIKLERELSEYVVKIGQQQIPISAGRVLLQFVAPSAATFLTLIDKKGKEVCRSEVPIASRLPTIGELTLPSLGQQGRPIEILGSFDGNPETTRVRIGRQDMQTLTESPRRWIGRNTSQLVGVTEIEVREGDQVQRGAFRSLGISLSAPKLNLLRGEGTTLTIVVTGLEDLRESIPLVIENKSPGVISMGGGNLQQVMIAPGDVRQGSYTTERPLTGIERGGFTITATVTRNDQADQSQRGPVSP